MFCMTRVLAGELGYVAQVPNEGCIYLVQEPAEEVKKASRDFEVDERRLADCDEKVNELNLKAQLLANDYAEATGLRT